MSKWKSLVVPLSRTCLNLNYRTSSTTGLTLLHHPDDVSMSKTLMLDPAAPLIPTFHINYSCWRSTATPPLPPLPPSPTHSCSPTPPSHLSASVLHVYCRGTAAGCCCCSSAAELLPKQLTKCSIARRRNSNVDSPPAREREAPQPKSCAFISPAANQADREGNNINLLSSFFRAES